MRSLNPARGSLAVCALLVTMLAAGEEFTVLLLQGF